MKGWGQLALIAGVVALIAALSMDTSVSTGYGRVNNLGLMKDQQNYIFIAIALMVIGLMMVIGEKSIYAQEQVNLSKSPTTSYRADQSIFEADHRFNQRLSELRRQYVNISGKNTNLTRIFDIWRAEVKQTERFRAHLAHGSVNYTGGDEVVIYDEREARESEQYAYLTGELDWEKLRERSTPIIYTFDQISDLTKSIRSLAHKLEEIDLSITQIHIN